jgi:hypothetical protein
VTSPLKKISKEPDTNKEKCFGHEMSEGGGNICDLFIGKYVAFSELFLKSRGNNYPH